mgnify:CR=1 FL=1
MSAVLLTHLAIENLWSSPPDKSFNFFDARTPRLNVEAICLLIFSLNIMSRTLSSLSVSKYCGLYEMPSFKSMLFSLVLSSPAKAFTKVVFPEAPRCSA